MAAAVTTKVAMTAGTAAVAAVATRWKAADAFDAFSALSQLAEEFGFRLSMFGSVLNDGEGADLDLLFSPFGDTEQREVQFLARFGGILKGSRINAAHNVKAYQVEKDGRLYDFVFGGFWSPRRKR
jgi:hypothetical protein